MRLCPHIAIFLGSFLSFFVQPMVGRTLLPYFGGSSNVWITCLVAFQVLLLIGYGYASIPARKQGRCAGCVAVHLILLWIAAALSVAVPSFRGSIAEFVSSMPPSLGVLIAVLAIAGLPSIVLSSNSTLVQSWTGGGREVYHLYAISNVGSFIGLLVYPIAIEPFVSMGCQWRMLGGLIAVYAFLLLILRRKAVGVTTAEDRHMTDVNANTCFGCIVLWIALPALSCAIMTAATNFLTSDIVALPLVWTILLAAFLVSYVIGFSKIGERFLLAWMALALVTLAFAVWAMLPKDDNEMRFYTNAGAVLLLLIVVCSALHSWLFAIRPETNKLPLFYFSIALGGSLGGILSGVIPVLVFTTTYEYPIVLAISCVAIGIWVWKPVSCRVGIPLSVKQITWGVLACVIVVILIDRGDHDSSVGTRIYRDRGFYGVVSVEKQTHTEYALGKFCDLHIYRHGKTTHGAQLTSDRRMPTIYYSLNGGGIPFATRRPTAYVPDAVVSNKEIEIGKPLRVAVVGMGMGVLAAYGKPGDYFRLYEISPEVINVATNQSLFSFVSDCPAKVEIVDGDARVELQKDAVAGIERFDIIAVDVYSGDSVPGHLVTKEAFSLFKTLLKDDGILAFHISNWHIDLYSVMKAAAKHLKMNLVETLSGPVKNAYASETAWAFMTNEPFDPYMPNCCRVVDLAKVKDIPLMTDDCGSLIFNINFGYYPELKD